MAVGQIILALALAIFYATITVSPARPRPLEAKYLIRREQWALYTYTICVALMGYMLMFYAWDRVDTGWLIALVLAVALAITFLQGVYRSFLVFSSDKYAEELADAGKNKD